MKAQLRIWFLSVVYALTKLTQDRFPQFAGRTSNCLWFTPLKKRPHKRYLEMCASSQEQTFRATGKHMKLRTWGSQNTQGRILLVHGWSGRWDQFTEMIDYLTGKGYQVSAFDFPGHGESPGLTSDVMQWAEALTTAAKLVAGSSDRGVHFICHSFGLFAVSYAHFERQMPMRSLIALNSPTKFYFIFNQFISKVGLSSKAQDAMLQLVKKRIGPNIEERLNVPVRRLHKTLPFRFVADQQDKEVPFGEHAEIASLLQDDFFVTQKLGHNGVLRHSRTHEQILQWIT